MILLRPPLYPLNPTRIPSFSSSFFLHFVHSAWPCENLYQPKGEGTGQKANFSGIERKSSEYETQIRGFEKLEELRPTQ